MAMATHHIVAPCREAMEQLPNPSSKFCMLEESDEVSDWKTCSCCGTLLCSMSRSDIMQRDTTGNVRVELCSRWETVNTHPHVAHSLGAT